MLHATCTTAIFLGGISHAAIAQNTSSQYDSTAATALHFEIGHGRHGFEFRSSDERFLLQIQGRVQLRYSNPTDTDPLSIDDFGRSQQLFKVNRARMKVGGHAYQSWLKYYWEYELQAGNLLDFRVALTRYPWLQIKAGQWKVQYNRERIISSGKQQLADRSLINRPFTVDRQQGVSLFGRIAGGGAADFSYWLSVFTGTGRGSRDNDDSHLMYLGRAQWNVFGKLVPFQGSDTQHHERPAGLIAFGAVTNRSRFTRFSQSGGGDLEGFTPGTPGQYRVNQMLAETALFYRGFSWQQEFHWKEINDFKSSSRTLLTGNYVQLGYFLHGLVPAIPRQLEVAFRHAVYDPDRSQRDDMQHEFSGAANWFVNGHLNKLTLEVTRFLFDVPGSDRRTDTRFRLQWDISI